MYRMIDLVSLLADRNMKLADLARACEVNPAQTTRWAQKRVPAERVIEVSRITGIPRAELRPDLYAEAAE